MSFDINSFSAIVAVTAAVFAWKSADAARKQNTIAGQAAILEYLLQKSSKIEGMRIETAKIQEWVHDLFASTIENFKDINKDKDKMKLLIDNIIFSQQKATNVIFCYHHYFKVEDWSKLKIWIQKVEKCKDLLELKEITDNSPLIEFNREIIPTMLEDIEKDIFSIQQKLRANI